MIMSRLNNLKRLSLIMDSQNKGLTVGELTIAVAACLIGALIWSSFSKEDVTSIKNHSEKLILSSSQDKLD
tara:strand:- start:730 stop:942 length:213 start_codon:yes stop_codon:yes gene_type:complete